MMNRLVLITVLGVASSQAFASTWIEIGDAGQTPITAQTTTGTGTLADLCGNLSSKNDVDIYCIRIVDVGMFEALSAAPYDTQLFLFALNGAGISAHDNISSTNNQSRITGQFVPGPGDYLLAISRYNNDPLTISNDLIWNSTPRATERAPDGPGAAGLLHHWNDGGSGSAGDYKIDFKGTTFCPSPGTAPMLVLAGVLAGRRRRSGV